MGLWSESELDNSTEIPACKCDMGPKMAKYMEEENVHQFLMGLDDYSYSMVQSQILVMDPLHLIDKIFNMAQEEENHKQMMNDRDHRSEAMVVFTTSHIA